MVVKTTIAVVIGVLLGLLPPYFIQAIIDHGIIKQDLGVISKFSILTLVAVLSGAGMTLLYGYWAVVMGQRIMCDMRAQLFNHLQRMSLKFFTGTRTGEIQTRLISDVQGVQTVVSNTLVDQLSNVAIVLSTIVAMFIMDWRLTLLSVGLVPLFMVIGRAVGEYARKVRLGTQEQTGELNAMMQETLSVSGILLTKTVGRRDLLTSRFDVENEKLAGWQIKSALVQYLFFGMIRLITQLAPALVYWLAGWLLIQQGDTSITVGMLVAFTGLQIRLFFPLTGLFGAQVEILSSFALFERIFQYLDMPVDIADKPSAQALHKESVKGKVEFKDVVFRYEDHSPEPTIRNVSFVAEPGQLIALVGPSGAGKTTLTYLVPRLYDPEAGTVLIDDVDVRDIKLDDLGTVVGAVTQETYLMHTTIKENLRIARPEATDEELVTACQAAAIHDHIASLSDGYDTVVGERGYKLSGGEKQRLAIARAILKNPRILILDEATSALDTRSERLIQESLSQLMTNRTTFAIAHRLSTILAADQILVLDKGGIVERGRHEELLALNGLYAKLYNQQFLAENRESEIV
ncbi:ABC transporter ATP-binding protein [Kamptonema cortianum]|nr:ABC transporter ATP-binding protein [Geitlerinema splendidum]MDK3158327.1 ABC transporter ATP-binding protein [Kamptonema cortianum]